jgi:hypothetical protein
MPLRPKGVVDPIGSAGDGFIAALRLGVTSFGGPIALNAIAEMADALPLTAQPTSPLST